MINRQLLDVHALTLIFPSPSAPLLAIGFLVSLFTFQPKASVGILAWLPAR